MSQIRLDAYVYRRLFEIVHPALERIASTAPNAKYGPTDLYHVAIAQCNKNDTVAPTVRMMRRRFSGVMTNQRFLQLLGAIPDDEMLELCLDMIEASAQVVIDVGRLSGEVTMAVDEILVPRFDKLGKDHPDLKGGKKKNGTNFFEGYMTAQIVSGKKRPTLAVYPIANGESQTHFLGGIIENVRSAGAAIRALLLDRGFNSVANMLEMMLQNVPFIMPMRGNEKIYQIMREVDKGTGEAVREYTMTGKDGRTATFTLVVCRKKKAGKKGRIRDKYIAFATNIVVKSAKNLLRYIPNMYRDRWGIETGFRSLKDVRAKTKSPRTAARLFLMIFSLVFVNFWVLFKIWSDETRFRAELCTVLSDYADILWLYVEGRYKPI